MNAIALSPEQFIFAQDHELKTTSLKIAEAFEKRHADVLRAIEKITSHASDIFTQRNFALSEYIDESGKSNKLYDLTRDGFIMVVMSFTGEKAMAVKEAYINAFNFMAEKLFPKRNGLVQLPEPPTKLAYSGKLTLEHQDVIKALVKERAEALPKEMQAGATIRCWSAIKKKFGCTYKEIPDENFVNVISLLSRLPLEGELLAPPAPEQLLSRSEVEAMINERMKAPMMPDKLPHTGQTVKFNMTMNLELDGLIDGIERYGYRIIRIRDNAGLMM